MRVRWTKLTDHRHTLALDRGDGRMESVDLETRSCLLHDFTHFAVEGAARLDHGFFGLLAAGKSIAELTDPSAMSAYAGEMLEIEQSVAMLQSLGKTREEPAALHARIVELLAVQGWKPPPWLTGELVMEVARRPRSLLGEWRKIPYRTSMERDWPAT